MRKDRTVYKIVHFHSTAKDLFRIFLLLVTELGLEGFLQTTLRFNFTVIKAIDSNSPYSFVFAKYPLIGL